MGRPQTGPRPDRAGGILKAHLKIQRADGTTQILRESLKTRDKGVALRRWPSAKERLKRKAAGVGEIPTPIRPDD